MLKTGFGGLMKLFILSIVLASCNTDLHITMPEGPQGANGLSAYEIWKDGVGNGSIDWDKDLVEEMHFFLYLKGKNGENGKDGADGKSAYEIWKEEVNKGLDDPHNPGQLWPKDKITIQNFWQYLAGENGADGKDGSNGTDGKDGVNGSNGSNGSNGTDGINGTDGTNGLSAYELWKQDAETGNLDDPHNPGQKWDKNKTTEDDFWEYLRGEDGEDGKDGKDGEDGKDGTTGAPGDTIKIVQGIANVIPRYTNQQYNEFVNVEDGSVLFNVYDKNGNVAPAGTLVKDLPGVPDPTKVYTVGANGEFRVAKADLPKRKSGTDRRGAASVDLQDGNGYEASAANVYVPNEISTRLILGSSTPSINNTHNVYYQLQRNINTGDTNTAWEIIPAYLGIPAKTFVAEELSDSTDVSSFTTNEYHRGARTVSAQMAFSITREVKPNPYCSVSPEWDGKAHFFNVRMDDQVYGEKHVAPTVIKMAPIQLPPRIKDGSFTYNGEYVSGLILKEVKGDFYIDEVDKSLIFSGTLLQSDKGTYTFISPRNAVANDHKHLSVSFEYFDGVTSHVESNSDYKAAFDAPYFTITGPYVGAKVIIKSSNLTYFLASKEIGTLEPDGSGGYKLVGSENFPSFSLGNH